MRPDSINANHAYAFGRRVSAGATCRHRWLLALLAGAALCSAAGAQSVTSSWVVGGHGESWASQAGKWIAFEDTTQPGTMRLPRLPEGMNLLGDRLRADINTPRNMLGYKWVTKRGRYGMAVDTVNIGWHPRTWQGGAAEATGLRTLLDGDEITATWIYGPSATQTRTDVTWFTFDLGVPIPIDSILFMPPQYGMHNNGQLYRAMSPEAYEVTRGTEPLDWLIFDDETTSTGSARYHPLKEVVGSTYSNNASIVGLPCRLRFTRFIRLRFGGVRSTGVLCEVKAFGRGYPQEGRYVSKVHSFGQPVSLGKVTWHFTRYRLDPVSGRISEDPTAPVALAIRSRSGDDPDPQAYFKYDELGRQLEVDAATYYGADAPRGAYEEGLPDFRAALTDDIGHWNTWSAVYEESGDEIRSSDGRQYFQFRVEMTTQDPMAFGVLDSLAFEVSPLLADSVLAEVSLPDQLGTVGAAVEVPLGMDTLFAYDLRTVVKDTRKPGFDTIELDVPAGTRLEELVIDGRFATAGADYSVLPSADGRLRVGLPAAVRRTTQFRAMLRLAAYQRSMFLGGQLVNRTSSVSYLPQSIEGGDATIAANTNGIQVVGTQVKVAVVGDVRLTSPVVTPNGDGINDQTAIAFDLFGIESAPVTVEVFDLAGTLIEQVYKGALGAGRHEPLWPAAGGQAIAPGVYLVRVQAAVDDGTFTRVVPIAVAY
jgi:hypothetical protein